MDSLAIYSRGNPLLCGQYPTGALLLRAGHIYTRDYSLDRTSVTPLDHTALLESLCGYLFYKEEMDIGDADVDDGMHAACGSMSAYVFLFRIDTRRLCLHGFFLSNPRHCG